MEKPARSEGLNYFKLLFLLKFLVLLSRISFKITCNTYACTCILSFPQKSNTKRTSTNSRRRRSQRYRRALVRNSSRSTSCFCRALSDKRYTIVKDYVRSRKRSGKEMFVPWSHPPGHAQANFGETLVVIASSVEVIAKHSRSYVTATWCSTRPTCKLFAITQRAPTGWSETNEPAQTKVHEAQCPRSQEYCVQRVAIQSADAINKGRIKMNSKLQNGPSKKPHRKSGKNRGNKPPKNKANTTKKGK